MFRRAVTAILVLGAMAACGGRDCVELPEELRGRWTTSDPPYVDRHMVLRPGEVEFGIGGTKATRHPLACVVHLPEEDRRLDLYDLVYHSPEGEEYTLSLQYDPSRLTLRLKNRDQAAWTRSGTGDAG